LDRMRAYAEPNQGAATGQKRTLEHLSVSDPIDTIFH
jgi:hypothetical protein